MPPPPRPIEIPWMNRLPAREDVADHHRAHPAGWGPGGALWLLDREGQPASLLYLFVDEDGHVRVLQGAHTRFIDSVDFVGCRFLPVTHGLLPAFLFVASVPIDPTGAPIRHVPTEQALRSLSRIEVDGIDEHTILLFPDLQAVVRERDHHAKRVGELLQDGTWLRLRARAFATFLSSVFECMACGWTGSPWSAQVDPRGLFRCPRCELPALVDPRVEPPGWMRVTLLEEIMMAAEGGAWPSASRAAEALAKLSGAGTLDGERARRAAWRGAIAAGYVERAAALRERYLAEPELLRDLAADLRTNAPALAVRTEAVWACCGTEVCICGNGWPVPLDIQAHAAGSVQVITPGGVRVRLRDGESLALAVHQGMPVMPSALSERIQDALADVPEELAFGDRDADADDSGGIRARLSRMLATCDLPNTSLTELAAEAQAIRQLAEGYPSLKGRLWEVERAISALRMEDTP